MKAIKVILLTNNTVLISEIEEVGADVGEPDCKLINPYIITTSDQKITIQENVATLSPWMKRFSKETKTTQETTIAEGGFLQKN